MPAFLRVGRIPVTGSVWCCASGGQLLVYGLESGTGDMILHVCPLGPQYADTESPAVSMNIGPWSVSLHPHTSPPPPAYSHQPPFAHRRTRTSPSRSSPITRSCSPTTAASPSTRSPRSLPHHPAATNLAFAPSSPSGVRPATSARASTASARSPAPPAPAHLCTPSSSRAPTRCMSSASSQTHALSIVR